MNDWLMPTAAAALGLFVFFKGVRFFYKPSPLPEKTGPKDPPDEDALARRARDLFLRVQKAWDARDMETLASLVTPDALEELEAQAAADEEPTVTEVLHVSAGMVSRLEGEDADAFKVLFDVVLREKKAVPDPLPRSRGSRDSSGEKGDAEPSGDDPIRIRELWHIVNLDGEWRVDAIRQIE